MLALYTTKFVVGEMNKTGPQAAITVVQAAAQVAVQAAAQVAAMVVQAAMVVMLTAETEVGNVGDQ